MSKKETLRLLHLTEVEKEEITLKKDAELMELSYPQTKRIWSNYKKFGPKGHISKTRNTGL